MSEHIRVVKVINSISKGNKCWKCLVVRLCTALYIMNVALRCRRIHLIIVFYYIW